MTQPPFDVPHAHRWFAIECNNQAWEIVEAGERTPEAVERLLHLAHAALLHWSAVGTSLNRQRALDLLTHAYVAAGRGELALQYALQAFELSEQHGGEQTPFDRAQALGTMCVALRAAGQAVDAENWKHKVQAASEVLDADERDVIQRLMKLGGI